MKKTRRSLSLILTMIMCVALAVPAFAAGFSAETSDLNSASFVLVEEQITPRGPILTYSFSVPADGQFYQIPEFQADYNKNSFLTVSGTWTPSYGDIRVRLVDETFGGSAEADVKNSGASHDFGLWKTSTWGLYVRANTVAVSGLIQISVR